MTPTIIPTPLQSPAGLSAGEWSRVQRLAAEHDLPAKTLAQLIADARSEARNRRRRLPDTRLIDAVNTLARQP
jgi:hypothetical protein